MTAKHSPSLRVAFRTDASIQIGTGHVMRCLTLADALVESGAECYFISRVHEGSLNGLIEARGHKVFPLPVGQSVICNNASPSLAHLLGTSWTKDAEQTLQALDGIETDWLVVDHYALDADWETALRPACRRLMVIDDLADRKHNCDLLLDQSLGRKPIDYQDLVPPESTLLTGTKYALLRPEFAAIRDESLARRNRGTLEHLLITMGGVDKENVTGQVLEALSASSSSLPTALTISVIMGPHAPWRDKVRAQAETMPWPTQVAVGVSDMARRMSDADLVIGAAGSTSWERCCLGVPAVIFVLAENQRQSALALQQEGAGIIARSPSNIARLLEDLTPKIQARPLKAMINAAQAIVDGRGTTIIARRMLDTDA